MSSSTAPQDAILGAFWRVIASSGWHGLTMRAIADEAGTSLAELRRSYDCPLSILDAHEQNVDAMVLAGTVDDPTSSARDRLFDVLMRRMDAIQPYREGVVRLMHDLPRTPMLALALAARMPASMAWMLEAAGLDASGPGGALRAQGLGAVWLAGLRAWEKDESVDLSGTMAALDRALDQADRLARMLGFGKAAPVMDEKAPAAVGPDDLELSSDPV